jgi:putative ABC transport system permease protein
MDFQYLPAAERDLYRKPEQTGWMIRLKDGADGTEIVIRLYREKGYVTTLMKSVMKKGFEDILNQFDLFAWMLVVLCGLVGLFIVVNTGWNNLHEQKLSLSVLRAIGFQQRQISARWFLQSLLYLVLSLLIGFGIGQIVAVKSMDQMNNSIRHLEYIPALFQYAWTGISTFVFILAGHLIMMRSMKKWNLVENTKGRE